MTTPAPAPAPTDAGQGATPVEPAAPEVTPAPEPVTPSSEAPDGGVQPTPTDATQQPQHGGQELIAPYLEGVSEEHRDVVADALERYRQDSDANITKRFEELNRFKAYAEDPQALETPVALYENLMEDPKGTVQWILDQFAAGGIDLRSQLLGEAPAGDPAPAAPGSEGETPEDKPLTVAEWQRLEEEREAAKQQKAETERRRELAKGWFEEATKQHGLEVGEQDIAVRQAILQHAASLIPQFRHLGDEAGKAAVTTAVEAFVNRFGKTTPAPAGDPTPEPTVAAGGTPPAPVEPDLTDPKARKAWMLQRIGGSQNQE